MQADFKKDWLEKAFRLAYFILEDRESAKRVATDALAKLEVASNAQFKRYYYTPTGRADASRAVRSRVTVNDLQLLQRLVFAGTEDYERAAEESQKAPHGRLLIHFVKHLVRVALKRNSFYVTLAVTRILHNYGTSETLGLYGVVVQDPERVPDDHYCRSRKGLLMKELKARFGELLETSKSARGEERFRSVPTDEQTRDAVFAGLAEFTPWSSKCHVPAKFDPFTDVIAPFHFDRRDPDDEHRIEVGRIHAVLHPECFGRLTDAMKMATPAEKMEIPMFTTNDATRDDDFDPRGPEDLDDAELDAIGRELQARAERRKAMTVGMLRVLADGREIAAIGATGESDVVFRLDESAEVIEILARENGRDEILATHLMTHGDFASGALRRTLALPGKRSLALEIEPKLDEFGDVEYFESRVQVAETGYFAAIRRAFAAIATLKVLVPTAAVLLLALAIGFGLMRGDSAPNNIIATKESPTRTSTPQMSPEASSAPPPVNATPSPSATPEIKKNSTRPPEPAPKQAPAFKPSMPRENDLARDDRVPETDDAGILRLPIYERPEISRGPSRGEQTLRGETLRAVRTIFLDITGDRTIGGMIRESLTDELERGGRFHVTSNREQADAALKVFVRHESDGDDPEDRSATLIVRLVNARGFVIYPDIRRASGWKYVGVAVRLAPRIARDLSGAASRAR